MNEKTISAYMGRGETKPGSLDQIFKPLNDEITADIALMVEHLNTAQTPTTVIAAFNRLMTELHICTESSRDAMETKTAYHQDLNAIDKELDGAGVPDAPTVTRVQRLLLSNDINSITRLVNPSGWVVSIRNGESKTFFGDMTMHAAIASARSN